MANIINGYVCQDTNQDGTGDIAISGVTVESLNTSGEVVENDVNSSGGFYSFNNINSGDYQVRQTNLPGFVDVSDSDGGDPNLINVTVVDGGVYSNLNFVD